MQKRVRLLDKVAFKGASKPTELYTFDLYTQKLSIEFDKDYSSLKEFRRSKILAKMRRKFR